jgi:hypothetical protein
MSKLNYQELNKNGIALEYFSKVHFIWKPLLSSDNIEKLLKFNYQMRVKHE